MVGTDGPEERQTWCKSIDVQSGTHTGTEIFQTVGQGISQLDICRSTSFLHVVTGDGNGVELRHLLRSIFKDVGNDLHGKCRRIDIGIAHHEFLQNIVLDGTGHFFKLGSLLQTGIDIKRHDGQHGTVHRHGYGHLVQRNAVEQYLHVLQRADGYTGLTNVTHYTFVVGVVTAVRSQVKRHRQTFLTGSQITAIERIRFFGRRETCILTDCPRTQGVHY